MMNPQHYFFRDFIHTFKELCIHTYLIRGETLMEIQNIRLPLKNSLQQKQKFMGQNQNNQVVPSFTSKGLPAMPYNYMAPVSFKGESVDPYAEYRTLDLENPAGVKDVTNVTVGQKFKLPFTITRDQIKTFAEISGDKNPIHINPAYIKEQMATNPKFPFKDNIAHACLVLGKFSAVYGQLVPGEDTLYTNINEEFNVPVYPDHKYYATFEVVEVMPKRRVKIRNQIIDPETKKVCYDGYSELFHPTKVEKLLPKT